MLGGGADDSALAALTWRGLMRSSMAWGKQAQRLLLGFVPFPSLTACLSGGLQPCRALAALMRQLGQQQLGIRLLFVLLVRALQMHWCRDRDACARCIWRVQAVPQRKLAEQL